MSSGRPPPTATTATATATAPSISRKSSASTTTTSNNNKQPAAASAAVTAHPTALLHPTCTVLTASASPHRITLAAHSIIQLRTRLDATHAPVTIGEGAIVNERCSIGFLSKPPAPPPSPQAVDEEGKGGRERSQPLPPSSLASSGCNIGRHVIIESGAVVEAASVGAYAVVGAGARLGLGCVVGEGAKVGPLVVVGRGEVVGAGEVVWGGSEFSSFPLREEEEEVEEGEGWSGGGGGWGGDRRADGGMGMGGGGVRVRKEAVEGLGEVYRRLWTGK